MIAGARQVGKSTLLRHYLPGVKCVTFDSMA
jgi:predicted AAA+ superfamily ATPase